MSGLAWKLRRLRAMSAGELAHRARVAARDRWFPPRWASASPAAAYRELFRPGRGDSAASRHRKDFERLAAWMRAPAPGETPAWDHARHVGDALLAGRWSLFGHDVRLPGHPDWNANLLTGAAWPDTASDTLDYHRTDVAGGAKFAWELGRLTFLPDLALAARVTGEPSFARRARELLADWNAKNPYRHGIHHTSGIEMAIRVLTLNATLALLRPEALEGELERTLGLLAQQALHCRGHLSLGSSANNHLLGEYAAMAVMGSLHPSLRGAGPLARAGLSGLAREIPRQFHADGVSAEQSFGYLPFIWELVLAALRAGEVAGHRAEGEVRARLAASLEFARAVRLPDGRMPQVGDEDDGRVFLAGWAASRLDLAGNALAAWLGAPALSDDAGALAALLSGGEARAAATTPDGRHEFPEGGWSVWRERGLLVTFDHGPLGLGRIAAHGHADALSVTIWRGSDGLVVDPGTFAYHEDAAARERFRGTPAHSTVRFGTRSQSESQGPFLWGRRATVSAEGDGWRCAWASGETHVRRVRVADGVISIEDQAHGRDAELVFALSPGARAELEGAHARVTCGAARATFEGEGLSRWRIEPAEHSPGFARREGASRLVASLEGASCRTRIETGTGD